MFSFSQVCLEILQALRAPYDTLAPTYLFSGFLSAACLSGRRQHRKKGEFNRGNDLLCVRGYELESHLLVLVSSCLEITHFFSLGPELFSSSCLSCCRIFPSSSRLELLSCRGTLEAVPFHNTFFINSTCLRF